MATGHNLHVEMPDYRKRNTFTSYVAPLPGDRSGSNSEWIVASETREVLFAVPRLLPGELIAASAPAYMYTAIAPVDDETATKHTNSKEAIFGLLTVTNFKLAFVPLNRQDAHTTGTLVEPYQENLLLQRNEVTLNNIDTVYTIAEAGRAVAVLNAVTPNQSLNKRKKLDAQQKTVSGRIAALHVVCKNFRLLKFAIQQQDAKTSGGATDPGKIIASALAHFAYPSRHELNFGYFYTERYYSTLEKSSVTMYTSKNDWARELIRCGATEWKVVSTASEPLLQRKAQASKYTLPTHFVIPMECEVDRYLNLTHAFCDSRAAFWVYGYGNASLVRMAELRPASQQATKLENIMLEVVRKCNSKRNLKLLRLTDLLPSIHDVQRAYVKFRRLCTPETPSQFLLQDSKFLTLLEKSNWLFYVSLCLRYASEAADALRAGESCVLQETNGRDLCCVISSVTQIILDPFYRTIDGFQSLIQKEWVALEHPFQRRLGHCRNKNSSGNDAGDEEESPIFLLFLDCVWQLLRQYPEEFEFSQTYLTTLWDACFMPIFDTFQFDTEAERSRAFSETKFIQRPVWDWSEQYAEKDKVFFANPFYQRQRYDTQQQQHMRRSIAVPPTAATPTTTATAAIGGLQQVMSARNRIAQHNVTAGQQRYTINPQLFEIHSTIPKDRYLEPRYQIHELEVWEQCYYRWLPVLDIRGGGYPQLELQHRMLLSNIARLQRAIELQDFDDLPDVYYELTGEVRSSTSNTASNKVAEDNDSIEYVDGVERRRKPQPPNTNVINGTMNEITSGSCTTAGSGICSLPMAISSFFPFGTNAGESPQQLLDILSTSHELLLEGSSIMDRLSIT